MRRVNLSGLLLFGFIGVANAHPEFNPIESNRYIKLSLIGDGRVRIAYTLMFGNGPAFAERKAADSSSNGKVDRAESDTLGARWRERVGQGLHLELDGKRIAPSFDAATVGLLGDDVGPLPLSIDLTTTLSAGSGGAHELILDDETVIDRLGETEVRIEESPAARLDSAGRGALRPGDKQTRFQFRGPKYSALEDRRVVLRWTDGSDGTTNTRMALALGGALALVGLFVGWRYWRRKG